MLKRVGNPRLLEGIKVGWPATISKKISFDQTLTSVNRAVSRSCVRTFFLMWKKCGLKMWSKMWSFSRDFRVKSQFFSEMSIFLLEISENA